MTNYIISDARQTIPAAFVLEVALAQPQGSSQVRVPAKQGRSLSVALHLRGRERNHGWRGKGGRRRYGIVFGRKDLSVDPVSKTNQHISSCSEKSATQFTFNGSRWTTTATATAAPGHRRKPVEPSCDPCKQYSRQLLQHNVNISFCLCLTGLSSNYQVLVFGSSIFIRHSSINMFLVWSFILRTVEVTVLYFCKNCKYIEEFNVCVDFFSKSSKVGWCVVG